MRKLKIIPIVMFLHSILYSQTNINGNITQNTDWAISGSPYIITNTVTVNQGITLTIQPGVFVKSSVKLSALIIVKGSLKAQGTATQPIIFTSLRDDEYGGDSNNDGNSSKPEAKDWSSIRIDASSTNTSNLSNCIIRYGSFYDPAVYATGSNPSITTCKFFKCDRGLGAFSYANPTIQENTFEQCVVTPVVRDISSQPSFENNTFVNNGLNGIGLESNDDNLSGNSFTLTKANLGSLKNAPYIILSTLNVKQGVTLTVQSGIIIKSDVSPINVLIVVRGTLKAQGTANEPIVFTSKKDDEYSGDTNNDGNSNLPKAKDWSSIRFDATSENTSTMSNCIIRYGSFYDPAIHIVGCNPTITNCKIFKCDRGLGAFSYANPTIQTNNFEQCTVTPVVRDLSSQPSFENNTFIKNGLNGIGVVSNDDNLAGNSFTLSKANLGSQKNAPYIILRTLEVKDGVTLTIQSGIIIKSDVTAIYETFLIKGSLKAQGTTNEPIVFTSQKDDEYSGDTNNDGISTKPKTSDWEGLIIQSGNTNSIQFEYCHFRYGGYYDINAMIYIKTGNVTVTNCTFYKGKNALKYVAPANLSFSNLNFISNKIGIVSESLSSTLSLDKCTFEKNTKGVSHVSGNIIVHNSYFSENTQYDFENLTTQTIDATRNWWGLSNFLEMRKNTTSFNAKTIYDLLDNSQKGRVNYFPLLIPKDSIFEVSPRSTPTSSNTTTVKFFGYPFSRNSSIILQKGDIKITPISITFIDSIELQASFNWTGKEPGIYDVVIVNSPNSNLKLIAGFSILDIPTIPFGQWVPFEVKNGTSYAASVNIPTTENLFAFVKKSNRLGYSNTWDGTFSFSRNYGELEKETDKDFLYQGDFSRDIETQITEPSDGIYFFEIKTLKELGKGYIKFASEPDNLALGKWSKGEILRPYGYDWKYIDVPEGTSALYIKTEGYGRWSTIDVFYGNINSTNKAKWTLKNWGKGYQIESSIPNPLPGRYYIRYMDSAVLIYGDNNAYTEQNQKREYLIQVHIAPITTSSSLPLKITSLSTYEAGKGKVSLDINGTGFQATNIIVLEKSGSPSVITVTKKLSDLKDKWTISFDLTSITAGDWTLKITEGGASVTAPSKLAIKPLNEPKIEYELITSSLMRAGRYKSVVVEVQNKGNIDAVLIPVFIRLSGSPQIEFSTTISRVYQLNDTLLKPNFSVFTDGWRNWDDVKPYFTYTNITTGETFTYLPILLTLIRAGEKQNFEFKVKYLTQGKFTVDLIASVPIVPNDKVQYRNANSNECALEIADLVARELLDNLVDKLLPDVENCVSAFVNAQTAIGLAVGQLLLDRKVKASTYMDLAVPLMSQTALCAAEGLPQFKAIKTMAEIMDAIAKGVSIAEDSEDLGKKCFDDDKKPKKSNGEVVNSMTPEDKFGFIGVEQSENLQPVQRRHFIKKANTVEYKIDYWNKADATAPAAEVFIRDTIDTTFDLKSFNFTEIGFLRWRIPLQGGHYFNVNIDMRPDYNYIVNVEGTVNPNTREVYWVHRTLDPITLDLPQDALAGYLPPVDGEGYFIGWVKFNIGTNSGLPSGTIFKNQARVNFDGVGPWGPAPPYGPYINTYDFDAPSSQVMSVTDKINDTTYTVRWKGNDGNGCGIGTYDIYISENGGSYTRWLYQTRDSSSKFIGKKGKNYCFYSLAYDKLGNIENQSATPDACLTMTTVTKDIVKTGYELFQNTPNPFSEETIIKFKIPISTNVKIIVFNELGQTEILTDKFFTEGEHYVIWKAQNQNPSVYFYRIITSEFTKTKKMVYGND